MTEKATYKVGPKGQVVLPKTIRDELGIEPGDEVDVRAEGRDIYIRKAEPARSLRGILKDSGDPLPLTRALELERRWERAQEDKKAAEWALRDVRS